MPKKGSCGSSAEMSHGRTRTRIWRDGLDRPPDGCWKPPERFWEALGGRAASKSPAPFPGSLGQLVSNPANGASRPHGRSDPPLASADRQASGYHADRECCTEV